MCPWQLVEMLRRSNQHLAGALQESFGVVFATFEAPSGEFTSLHGQIDQIPAGEAEGVNGVSSVWAPGIPALVVSEAHCIF